MSQKASRDQRLAYKNKRFKHKALICPTCNNHRTQPYDLAWGTLHKYLAENWKDLSSSTRFDLSNVFPGSIKRSMRDVHLFFVKLFGCTIKENDIPIDIDPFSKSLLRRKAHQEVYISIGPTMGEVESKFAGRTEVIACNLGGRCVFASWFYIVGEVSVNVIYSTVGAKYRTLSKPWYPRNVKKVFRFADFEKT